MPDSNSSLRSIKNDFLQNSTYLNPFYPHNSNNLDWLSIISKKEASYPIENRKILHDVLQKQHPNPTAKQAVHLDKLLDSKTFTLTTGHQLVLGTGPLFSIYKTLTIIHQAAKLQQEFPNYHFIPLFWMASEDHDWAEANHCYPEPNQKFVWPGETKGPVGRRLIQAEEVKLLEDPLLSWLQPFYLPGITWEHAFRNLMQSLWGESGLLILNADDPIAKTKMWPLLEAEKNQGKLSDILKQGTDRLAEHYPIQANVRELNFFWLTDKERIPIKIKEQNWITIQDDIISQEYFTPENAHHFSPAALTRPLYQELLLPNIAYSGGWGELSYWVQLSSAFEYFKLPFPALLPRISLTVLPENIYDDFIRLGFLPEDIFKVRTELEDHMLNNQWSEETYIDSIHQLSQVLNQFPLLIEAVEASLLRTFEGERIRFQQFMEDTLRKKIRKQLKNKFKKILSPIEKLKDFLEPEAGLQERVLNIRAISSNPHQVVNWLLTQSTFNDNYVLIPKEVSEHISTPTDSSDLPANSKLPA